MPQEQVLCLCLRVLSKNPYQVQEIARTVNVSSFILPPILINKKMKHLFIFNLRESKNPAACVQAEIHVCTHPLVHTLLSGLVSLSYRLSFIMVKRMCAGHSDSFIHSATELGPTLLVFLAIENIFYFFKSRIFLIVWVVLFLNCL